MLTALRKKQNKKSIEKNFIFSLISEKIFDFFSL